MTPLILFSFLIRVFASWLRRSLLKIFGSVTKQAWEIKHCFFLLYGVQLKLWIKWSFATMSVPLLFILLFLADFYCWQANAFLKTSACLREVSDR